MSALAHSPAPGAGAAPPVVRFEEVDLRYPGTPKGATSTLAGVSFTLEQGAFVFLTGDSGAGKTSLLRLIWLAARPTGGRVRVFGHDTGDLRRPEIAGLRRNMGIVFQDFRLLDHLSAMENVALPLRIGGAKGAKVRDHVVELMRWVGLDEQETARPTTLSGGEQQRIAIARAVINRPSLLLADEPTGNVDERMAERLLYLFEELNRLGTTVVLATHNDALVRKLDHPVLHLADGRLTPRDPHAPPAAASGRTR